MHDPAVAHTIEKLQHAARALEEEGGDARERLARAWRQLVWIESADLPVGPWRDDFLRMNQRVAGRPDPRPLAVDRLSDEEVGWLSGEVRALCRRVGSVTL